MTTYRVRLALGVALSAVVGFLSSFLGIGGGIIHVPLLVQALGFPVHVATATSHFVLVFMSGTGTVTHFLQGSYRTGHGLRRTLALSAGVVAGAQLGAHVSLRMSGTQIQRLLALALVALSVALHLPLSSPNCLRGRDPGRGGLGIPHLAGFLRDRPLPSTAGDVRVAASPRTAGEPRRESLARQESAGYHATHGSE